MDELKICERCSKQLTDEEIYLYDDVCEDCMDEMERELDQLKEEYFRSLL